MHSLAAVLSAARVAFAHVARNALSCCCGSGGGVTSFGMEQKGDWKMLSWKKNVSGSVLVISAILIAGCNEPDNGNMYVHAYSVRECSGGGYIFAGTAQPDCVEEVANYIQLVKTDASGAKAWDILFESEDLPRGSGASVRELSTGEYIVAAGNTNGVVVVRAGASGDETWTTSFQPVNGSALLSVFEMDDGGILVESGSLTKLSGDGVVLWNEAFADQDVVAIDGCEQTADGGFILTGRVLESDVTYPYLIRLDSSGSMLWLKQVAGESSENQSVVYFTDICVANNGDSVAIGAYWDTLNWISYNVVARFDAEGNELWRKTSYEEDSYASISGLEDIFACTNGDFVIAGDGFARGEHVYGGLIMRIDSQGEEVARSITGGIGYQVLYSVVECDDGSLVVAGYTYPLANGILDLGYPMSWLVKADSTTDVLWKKAFPETYPGDGPCTPWPRM